ncbi:MAG TPA: hypothetical protein VHW44_06870 [Pseudonocardiaceae bacterium]|jgi:hypothetical protein|nr:hypothetical protein [Pseudonocardiaceae bacterium]
MGDAAESACHELLVRLAGRLPDRQLWRFRDWLATGALPELAHVLPLTLLRERIGLTAAEFPLLQDAVTGQGADGIDLGLISSIREVDEPIDLTDIDYTFSVEPPSSVRRPSLGDPLAVLLGAILNDRPGMGEVRASWRSARQGGQHSKRVLLVTASTGCAQLTGELQRIQRAVGEPEPGVEVLPLDLEPPVYHRAALAASELLCAGADESYAQLTRS